MSEVYTGNTLLTMVKSGLRDIGYQDSLLKQEYSFVDVFTDDYKIRTNSKSLSLVISLQRETYLDGMY